MNPLKLRVFQILTVIVLIALAIVVLAALVACSAAPTPLPLSTGRQVDIRETATQTVTPTPTLAPTATPTEKPSERWEILNSLPKRTWSVEQYHEPSGYVVKPGEAVRFEVTCGNTLTQKIITAGTVPLPPVCNDTGFTKNVLIYKTGGSYDDLITFLKSDMASYAKTTAYPLVYQQVVTP